MHEASVAAGIIETVSKVAKQHGVSRVTGIKLLIGEFTCIQSEALRFSLETLGEGTVAEGAAINIEKVRTRAACAECGCEFDIEQILFRCPECGSLTIELVAGRELIIESIETE